MIFQFVYQNSMPFYGEIKAVRRGAGRTLRSARDEALSIQPVPGMKWIMCACLLAAFTVAGCASGPIDMAQGPEEESTVTIPQQASLRQKAEALTARVEAQNWRLASAPGAAARSFLGRLIGGESAAQDAGDPVADYLQTASTPMLVTVDISALSESAREVSRDARVVASTSEDLRRITLDRDIAAAESALGAVRRARAFFEAVNARPELGDDAVSNSLAEFEAAETALAEAADALAERRWSQHGEPLTG